MSDTFYTSLPCTAVESSEDLSSISVRQALERNKVQLFTLYAFGFGLFPALPLAMPCWTCPSFDSLGRCPLTSESSWTTHSEDTSSPSFGPSYTDLQPINAEEQPSGRASGADSTGKMESGAVRGSLARSLWATCYYCWSLCSQFCLQNEFRCAHPVKELEYKAVQNCIMKKHIHRLADCLAGHWYGKAIDSLSQCVISWLVQILFPVT